MRAKSWSPAVVCLVVATACHEKSPVGPTPFVDERFTLSPGERAAIRNTPIGLEFLRVSGDSRCPADAICIQGGDALVQVRIDGVGTAEYDLHTGDSSRASVTHAGYGIELLELQPYPFSSLPPIQPNDYRATLRVSR
jgi:hypothetical protein